MQQLYLTMCEINMRSFYQINMKSFNQINMRSFYQINMRSFYQMSVSGDYYRLPLYVASFPRLAPPFLPFVCVHNNTREQKTGYCECKWKVKTGKAWKRGYTVSLLYHSYISQWDGNGKWLILGLYYSSWCFPSVPQLLYLHARALQNLSLLIAWQLEYDGGFPVSNFLITVQVQLSRQRRNTPEFLHFEVSLQWLNFEIL